MNQHPSELYLAALRAINADVGINPESVPHNDAEWISFLDDLASMCVSEEGEAVALSLSITKDKNTLYVSQDVGVSGKITDYVKEVWHLLGNIVKPTPGWEASSSFPTAVALRELRNEAFIKQLEELVYGFCYTTLQSRVLLYKASYNDFASWVKVNLSGSEEKTSEQNHFQQLDKRLRLLIKLVSPNVPGKLALRHIADVLDDLLDTNLTMIRTASRNAVPTQLWTWDKKYSNSLSRHAARSNYFTAPDNTWQGPADLQANYGLRFSIRGYIDRIVNITFCIRRLLATARIHRRGLAALLHNPLQVVEIPSTFIPSHRAFNAVTRNDLANLLLSLELSFEYKELAILVERLYERCLQLAIDGPTNQNLHCECRLWRYHSDNAIPFQFYYIGVSQPICYNCLIYLKSYNLCMEGPACHTRPSDGRITFPWTCPADTAGESTLDSKIEKMMVEVYLKPGLVGAIQRERKKAKSLTFSSFQDAAVGVNYRQRGDSVRLESCSWSAATSRP